MGLLIKLRNVIRRKPEREIYRTKGITGLIQKYIYTMEYFLFVPLAVIMLLITTSHIYVLFDTNWNASDFLAPYNDAVPRTVSMRYHPTLMSMGIFFCSGNSMLLYRACCCYNRRVVKIIHTALHVLAIPFSISGIIVIQHYLSNSIHSSYLERSSTFHFVFGYITLCLFLVQCLLGFGIFYGMRFKNIVATAQFRAKYIGYHTFLGVAVFFFTVQQCVSGMVLQQLYMYSPIGYLVEHRQYDMRGPLLRYNYHHMVGIMKASVVMYAATCSLVVYILVREGFRHRGRIDISKDEPLK